MGELDGCVPAVHGVDTTLEDREIARLISAFLRRLSRENRVMFLRRYWYGDSLSDIAKRLGISQVQVSRMEKRILTRLRLQMTRS